MGPALESRNAPERALLCSTHDTGNTPDRTENPVNDAAMRLVLAQLELLSHADSCSFVATGSRSHQESKPPSGDARPAHERFREEWNRAGDGDKGRVWVRACVELQLARKRACPAAPVEESAQERDERICVEGEGLHFREVAIRFRTGEGTVVRARLAGGLDPEFGGAVRVLDAVEEARRLRAAGLSFRLIGEATGLKKSTVHRKLAA